MLVASKSISFVKRIHYHVCIYTDCNLPASLVLIEFFAPITFINFQKEMFGKLVEPVGLALILSSVRIMTHLTQILSLNRRPTPAYRSFRSQQCCFLIPHEQNNEEYTIIQLIEYIVSSRSDWIQNFVIIYFLAKNHFNISCRFLGRLRISLSRTTVFFIGRWWWFTVLRSRKRASVITWRSGGA